MNTTIKTVVFWLVIVICAFLLWQVVRNGDQGTKTASISYSDFLSRVESGSVAKVTVSRSEIVWYVS